VLGFLARLFGRSSGSASTAGGGAGGPTTPAPDAGPRIDAARQRLKQTIPPPEDEDEPTAGAPDG
jgi:hypothetical protein